MAKRLLRLDTKTTKIFSFFLFAALLSLDYSCGEKNDSPPIELNIAHPIDVAANSSGEYFYALNADINHRYASGSILILNKDGDKLSKITVPRLGRNLVVSGNDLLATFDKESGEDSSSSFLLFDISKPESPVLKKVLSEKDCSPLNAVMRKNYDYFAISCATGKLLIGTLQKNREDSTLTHVRTYPGSTRRAMYLDPKRELLFLFVTDMGKPTISDQKYSDKSSWDSKGVEISGSTANDVPDDYEKRRTRMLDIQENTSVFQYVIYDLKKGRENKFPNKDFSDVKAEEMRWMYFSLSNFDGTPDDSAGVTNSEFRYYRTNFWEAKPDLDNDDTFYLSHRGLGLETSSQYGNNIVKVNFTKVDPRGSTVDGKVVNPLTDKILKFSRVYGFKGDTQNSEGSFFGSFALSYLEGQKILYVNSFRDLVSFDHAQSSIRGMALDDPSWGASVQSNSMGDSYFQMALGQEGSILSASYFNHSLALLKFDLNDKMKVIKSIR